MTKNTKQTTATADVLDAVEVRALALINHDGVLYDVGDSIVLPQAQADALFAVGAAELS